LSRARWETIHACHDEAINGEMAPYIDDGCDHKDFVANIHGFISARGLEGAHFAKGQRKDDLAQVFLARCTEPEGVLFVGLAQDRFPTSMGSWRG